MAKKTDIAKKLLSLDEEREKKKQMKAKLLKIKLAATGINLGDPETRRNQINKSKKTKTFEDTSSAAPREQNQRRLEQERDNINKGTKIRPTAGDAKMNLKLRKKLAQLKQAKTSHDHGHTIIMKGHERGVYRSASLESQQGHYAKYWLLNAKQTNGNGWGIAAHSAKTNMAKFIGRPLVITSAKWHGASAYGNSYDHPYVPTNDLNKIFAHQEQYRVGNIVDIGEKNGDYFAMIEMLPKFANMTLPPFCSPAIYQLDAREAEGQISKWEALHLAALDTDPAYGARIALLKGTCVGTNNECRVQFKSAKQTEKPSAFSQERQNQQWEAEREQEFTHSLERKKAKNTAEIKSIQSAKRKLKSIGRKQTEDSDDDENQAVDDDRNFFASVTCPIKLKEKLSKLKKKLKLASQGEENMTFQNSKKIKIHKRKHPEVRKAQSSVEDILRKSGRSVDGSHHQSTFLGTNGDFIGGGDNHDMQVSKITGNRMFGETQTDDFLAKNNLGRVQTFPINRAGEKKTSVHINSKINNTQLKSIMDLEKGGKTIGFLVGDKTGNGSRDLVKALREMKFL